MEHWQHSHNFRPDNKQGERNTRWVILITFMMMVIEIAAGTLFGSMALLADGWHMGTHAAALAITAFAYYYARRHAENPRYSFSTGKVGVLGGFASAVVLAMIALVMGGESIRRLYTPISIHFNEAIGVAVIGLVVNIACALLLLERHGHGHDQTPAHHHDHNLKAAYLHVVADAFTSLLAIIALVTGKILDWVWMDPVMGIVGAVVITRWAYGLLQETSRILLDSEVDLETTAAIREIIQSDSDNLVADLHVWRISPCHLSAIVTVVTHFPQAPEHYKELLKDVAGLVHVTIEVHSCLSEPCRGREHRFG